MSHALAAACAPVFVIFHAGVAATYHGLHGEAVAQYPVITVGDAPAIQVAPVNDVFHTRKEGNLPHIIISVMSVHAEEMPLEFAAGPIS